jgi:signal peptidase II
MTDSVSNGAAPSRTTAWRQRVGALRWSSLALLVIILDQTSKALVAAKLGLFDIVTVLPVLEFTRLQNTGAAFSFLAGASGWQRWFFIALALTVSAMILVWLQRLAPRGHSLLAVGLALILGGALGNVIDRISSGYVIDFLHFHWQRWYFPAFNVADSAITIGAGLLILDALLEGKRRKVVS